MRAVAGSGALLCQGAEIPVAYDLVQSPPQSRHTAEGQLFGDPGDLHRVWAMGACGLRLESGRVIRVVLQDCEVSGAADAVVTSAMDWDQR
jgi:hypothetical protein